MPSFDPIVAEAYRRAALEGRDMYAFAGQMNRVKNLLATEPDLYKQWDRLDDLIGENIQTGDKAQELQLLRQAFYDALAGIFTEQVLQTGDGDAWQRWMAAFSEASFHWRLQALQALCAAPELDRKFGKKLDRYRQFIHLFLDRRWVETRPVFEQLAADETLPQEQRGYHHYVCGQIDLYFQYKYELAKGLFEKAQSLLKGKSLGLHGLIEYYLKGPSGEKDADRALALAEEALALDPDHIASSIQKADVLVEKGQLAEAENLYRMASRKRPGYGQCYTRLIDLFGKEEMFAKKENELTALMETVELLDPNTNFLTRTDLGGIYQLQGEDYFQKAEACHRTSMEQYPEGIVALLNRGYFYLDYQKEAEKALVDFDAAQKKAPDAWECSLAIARANEALENWDAALQAYQRMQEIIPSWARFTLVMTGRCLRNLDRPGDAENALLQAWALDHFDDSGALAELYEYAQNLYKNTEPPQPEKAIAVLERTAKARKGIPSDIAAGIANRQGHVNYYLEQYADALPFYQKASGLEPLEPVYYTNQFDCLEKLYRANPEEATYAQAIKALDTAAGLAPQDASIVKKRRQLALVRHNPHLANLPTLYQLHVEVGQPLLSQITTDFVSLQPEMLALTDALRNRIRERFAITLPGVRYRDITDGEGVYQFRLYETPVWLDRLPLAENETPRMADVLEQLEHFVSNYCLDLFVNYWDVDKEVPLLPNAELVHFTRVVMTLLAEQTPLPPLPELHRQYRLFEGVRQPVAVAVEQIRLWEKVRATLPGLQAEYRYIGLGEREEQHMTSFLTGAGNARALALPLDFVRSFMGAIVRKTQEHEGQQIALVTHQEQLRPYLRSVLAALPQIPVLKTAELPAGASERFLAPLVIDASDDAFFMQTYSDFQSNISPGKDQ
ncbi:MAG: tetratricopeptide repeat protein [Saprospiraceae bacterium]